MFQPAGLRKTVNPHFRAIITLLAREAGGRSIGASLIGDQFRPDARLAQDADLWGIHFVNPEISVLMPGESTEIDIWIRSAALIIMPRLAVGSEFDILQGKPIGSGVVTAIYRRDE